MKHMKSVIEVKIRLAPLEGWGHEPEDHVKCLKQFLNIACPWYSPEVKLLGIEEEK